MLCHSCGQAIPCMHCGGLVSKDDPHEFEHAACHAEWQRRYDAGKCMFCGKRDEHKPGSGKCSECVAMDDPPWLGYPGGT